MGENLADLGGLSIAVAAYRIAVANGDAGTEGARAGAAPSGSVSPAPSPGASAHKQPPGPDLTPLFLSWGRIWRSKTRQAAAIQSLATDPHAPNEFRANQVVKNVGAFADTFGVVPGDHEWLDPKDRVRVW